MYIKLEQYFHHQVNHTYNGPPQDIDTMETIDDIDNMKF